MEGLAVRCKGCILKWMFTDDEKIEVSSVWDGEVVFEVECLQTARRQKGRQCEMWRLYSKHLQIARRWKGRQCETWRMLSIYRRHEDASVVSVRCRGCGSSYVITDNKNMDGSSVRCGGCILSSVFTDSKKIEVCMCEMWNLHLQFTQEKEHDCKRIVSV